MRLNHFVAALAVLACLSFASSAVAQTGACCTVDGAFCIILTEAQCEKAGMFVDYKGKGTDCNACFPAGAAGACCAPGNIAFDAECISTTTPEICPKFSGTLTEGTHCGPDNACPTCGDGIVDDGEECDGDDDSACVDGCADDCTCLPACGDGEINQPSEECDGDDDSACPGECQSNCTCRPPPKITSVSDWGLTITAVLLFTGIALFVIRGRKPARA